MPSLLVIEDGTGVPGANSLVSVGYVTTWGAGRGLTDFAAGAQADQEIACIKASDYIRTCPRYLNRWSGSKKTYAQSFPWPRTGAAEQYGAIIPDTVVPWQAMEAVAYLAHRAFAGEDLQPDLERGDMLTHKRIGPIAKQWDPRAPVGVVMQIVDGLLAPLFMYAGIAEPSFTVNALPAGFTPGDLADARTFNSDPNAPTLP